MRIEEIIQATDYIYQHTEEYVEKGQMALEQLKKIKGRKDD